MAKIEMDVSEYEAMKKTERLLEESLKKERKLQDKIEELNKEKIKALEDAEKKVVKTVEKRATGHVIKKINLHELGYPPDDLFRKCTGMYLSGMPSDRIYSILNKMRENFFEVVNQDETTTESITTHGLDEIREEIRRDLESRMKKDISEAREVKKEVGALKSRISDLESENNNLLDANKSLRVVAESVEDMEKEVSELRNKEEMLNHIKSEALKPAIGLFGSRNILRNIRLIFKA